MAKKINEYPDWVEKYRTKGRTIRKIKNGYALYHCAHESVDGQPSRLVQTYLGMITEEDGFIPKKDKAHKVLYLEYGLSHLIWVNFLPELRRTIFAKSSKDNLVIMLGFLTYIFGCMDEDAIFQSALTFPHSGELIPLSKKISPTSKTLLKVEKKIQELFTAHFQDEQEERYAKAVLLTCVQEAGSSRKPALPSRVEVILKERSLDF